MAHIIYISNKASSNLHMICDLLIKQGKITHPTPFILQIYLKLNEHSVLNVPS